MTGTYGVQTNAGGLVGAINAEGTVIDCYSTCTVQGVRNVGGLVGQLADGYIERCYAAGDTTVTGEVAGGLVGFVYDPIAPGSIVNSYATGNIYGGSAIAGFVGRNFGGKIIRCYSVGTPTGRNPVGGFCAGARVEANFADTANFYDTQTTGLPVSSMGTGKTTDQMKTRSTFTASGWNFTSIWAICEGTNTPRLQWQIPAADWVCPDGVGIEDLGHLALQWLAEDCAAWAQCDGADLNADGVVNLADLAIFASEWQWNM